jgi:hypothetical protein
MLEYSDAARDAADTATDDLRELVADVLGGTTNLEVVSIALTSYAAGYTKGQQGNHGAPAETIPVLQRAVEFLDLFLLQETPTRQEILTHRNELAHECDVVDQRLRKTIRTRIAAQYGEELAGYVLTDAPLTDDSALEAGALVRAAAPNLYVAFVSQHKKAHDCRCPSCYMQAYGQSKDMASDVVRLSQGFGGTLGAMREFGHWMVGQLRRSLPALKGTSAPTPVATEESHTSLLSVLANMKTGGSTDAAA